MSTKTDQKLDLKKIIAEAGRKWPDMTEKQRQDYLLLVRRYAARRENGAATVHGHVISVPKNDDELWEWFRVNTGYEIPRVAVCEGHVAMFTPIADAFFHRDPAIFIVASRESGKSLGAALLQDALCTCFPGHEGVVFGAIEPQAKRVYRYLTEFLYEIDDDGNRKLRPEIDGEPLRSETRWRAVGRELGSILSIIVGSLSGVNSPHPQTVHADEVDLMDPTVFDQSRAMSSSKKLRNGKIIPALDLATSTRKSMKGPVQKLINAVDEAVKRGHMPAWKIHYSCFIESAAEVPCCRRAPDTQRRMRLAELGRDPTELCNCSKIVRGEWGENAPRTLESVCQGKLFRSRGWMLYEDIVRKFMQMSQAMWEAEMECRRPSAEGLYLPNWSRQRFTVRGWVPRPDLGYAWMGVDWGGSAASVVLWICGPLHAPVQISGFDGQPIIVPQGAYVVYKEISQAAVGATKLADMVCRQEAIWRQQHPGWRMKARFADMAGRQQREDWREHDPPLRTVWYTSRDFDPTVECLQDLVDDGLLYVDAAACPSLCDDIESWRSKDGSEVHDDASHGPAALRYCLTNVQVVMRRYRQQGAQGAALPVVMQRGSDPTAGVPGVVSAGQFESERWRVTLGPAGGGYNRGVLPPGVG